MRNGLIGESVMQIRENFRSDGRGARPPLGIPGPITGAVNLDPHESVALTWHGGVRAKAGASVTRDVVVNDWDLEPMRLRDVTPRRLGA